jgi:hypothetical protein
MPGAVAHMEHWPDACNIVGSPPAALASAALDVTPHHTGHMHTYDHPECLDP